MVDLPAIASPPNALLMVVATETDGAILDGTFSVNVLLADPILVSPLYVVTLTVHVPLVAFGTWLANDVGGVNEMVVAVDLVAAVVVELPNVYWTVCVNELLALEIVTV